MRFQISVALLAVLSNCVTAGPVRHRGGEHLQQDKFRRFYNTSSIASTSEDIKTSSPVILPSPSSSPSADATTEASTLGNAPAITSGQSLSTSFSAFGESSVSASQIPSTADTQTETPTVAATNSQPPSTLPLAASSASPGTESPVSALISNTAGSVTQSGLQQAVTEPTETSSSRLGLEANGGIKAGVVTPASVSAQSYSSAGQGPVLSASSAPTPTSASSRILSNAYSQASSSPAIVSSSSPAVQFAPSNSAEFAPVTAASSLATATLTGVQYPGTQGGSRAMATAYNEIYKKLDETSTCNPNDSNQANVCISGELASCQADGTYVLKSCPDGQSCYALPRVSGGTGVDVTCAVPSDAAAKLSGQSETSNKVAAASQATVNSQSAATPVTSNAQSLSTFPETESVQIPVQRLSTSSQATITPASQTQVSSVPFGGSVSASTNADNMQYSGNRIQSASSTMKNYQSQLESPTTTTGSQPTSSTQVASSEQSIQTLQSFPSAQATQHTQEAQPTSSSSPLSSTSVPSQPASQFSSNAALETASPTTSATIADGGPLFSLPPSTPKDASQQAQPTASSASTQETSIAASSPSLRAQEQPARSTETSQAPTPHTTQAAPEATQPTETAAASKPTSNVDGGGIHIVPEGGANSASAPSTTAAAGANEKLAVQNAAQNTPNPNASGTPIYITVTVTTTEHDLKPTA